MTCGIIIRQRANLLIKPFSPPFAPQKARLARIQIAKATSGAAFVSKKKAAEAKMAARAAGLPVDEHSREDIFEMQHHHLLRCLEKTTVSTNRFHLFCESKSKLNIVFFPSIAFALVSKSGKWARLEL